MRILLVEDEEKVARFVARGLKAERYAVDIASDGEAGLEFVRAYPYDLIVLDLNLPGIPGTELLTLIRKSHPNVPVLILTARDDIAEKVANFEAGADDYLTKPFSFAELVARVGAVMRRVSPPNEAPLVLEFRGLTLDRVSRRAQRSGVTIDLQGKEFVLLEFFMRNPGRPLSKTMILEHVWDYHFDPQTNVVDVLVSRLRSKIDRDFSEKLIHTIRGVGYVLRAAE